MITHTSRLESIANAMPVERASFIRRVYMHLAGAVALFVVLEYFLLQSQLAVVMLDFIGKNQYGWLMILGAFMLLGWLARGLAGRGVSMSMQYLGLFLYVLAQAIIFVPILYIAAYMSSPDLIPNAAILTLLLFLGLTAVVFITRKDFSFLGSALTIGGFVVIGLIICSVVFGFTLGLLFSGFMVIFAGAAILYDTSKILHHYATDQYVAASLEIFASVALLFWYVLRILMARGR